MKTYEEMDLPDWPKPPKQILYLAAPYFPVVNKWWHKLPFIGKLRKWNRFRKINKMAAHLMEWGYIVLSPISHSHHIQKYLPRELNNHKLWMEQDLAILSKCTRLVVYRLPEWIQSFGVAEEIDFAERNNIKIDYISYPSNTYR